MAAKGDNGPVIVHPKKENETDVYGEHALNENKQMFSFHLKDF